jgi:hypothetical protein
VSPRDVGAAMDKFQIEQGALKNKIVVAARAVVPVLLDAGRVNSAKELQKLLFQIDAGADEMSKLLTDNPDALLAEFRRRFRPRERD